MFSAALSVFVILGQKSYFIFQIMLVRLFLVFYLIQRLIEDFIQNFLLLIVRLLSMKEDELCVNIQASVFCSRKEPLQGTYYEGAFAHGIHLALFLQNFFMEIILFGKYL